MHVLFSHPTFVFVMLIYLTKIAINYLNNQLYMWSGALLVNKLHPFMQPRNTLLCLLGFTPVLVFNQKNSVYTTHLVSVYDLV